MIQPFFGAFMALDITVLLLCFVLGLAAAGNAGTHPVWVARVTRGVGDMADARAHATAHAPLKRAWLTTAWLVICLGIWPAACAGQVRLTEQRLADIAVIGVPSNLEAEDKISVLVAQTAGHQSPDRDDLMERLTFGFSSTYLWASMGSITTYRQQLIVSVMAPDAPDTEYAQVPRRMRIHYDERKQLPSRVLGTGTLTITEGIYSRGNVTEPAFQFLYADRSRRLQLVWHAVKKEVDLAAGATQIARIAASFRLHRDPVDWFAAMRDAPRQEAALRERRRATVQAMFKREGLAALVPGKPVLRQGVYIEWMADPEPRYQLLVPLGRARAASNGAVVHRPRPARGGGSVPGEDLAGTLGWREVADGEWVFSNQEQAYLPFKGIGALLAAQQQDPAFVYFYYAATVRVEEESDDRLLTSLGWFLDGVPDVQRRWREGTLLSPGKPERD